MNNCEWIRTKIAERGWAEEIEAEAALVAEMRIELEEL